jgi:TctA family transporter
MLWTDALLLGLFEVFSGPGILIIVLATLLAMAVSFLPGVGNASLAGLLLVVTIGWDQHSVLLLFGALTGGATFMGSITAILFNVPGNVSSTPTLLDGYPLARQGYPRTAIACAATASALGSVLGVLILLVALPLVKPFLLAFGPLEQLLIGIWGLLTIVSIPTDSLFKSVFMAALGLLVAMIGADPASGLARWDFGVLDLAQGFNLLAVLLGLFTFAELINWQQSLHLPAERPADSAPDDSIGRGARAVFAHPWLTMKSAALGSLVGMVPGVGGTIAGFVAYGHAAQSVDPNESRFGKGDIRGVIAPEAAVDAKDGGSLLPALAFGLPGSEAGVLLLAAFALHGLVPGPRMLDAQLPLVFILILALLFSNLLTSLLGLALTPWLIRLRHWRIDRIALPCLLISVLALIQLNSQLFDVHTAVLFGLLGYFMKRHDWPRVPFVVAFILGGMTEKNLLLTAQLVELGRISPLQRPATLVMAVLILASVGWLLAQRSTITTKPADRNCDLALLTILTITAGVLAWVAVTGGAAYSLYARLAATAVASFGMGGLVVLAIGRSRATGLFSRGLPLALLRSVAPPPEHFRPLLALVALGPATLLTGFSPALGIVSLIWMLPPAGASARRYGRALLISLVVALVGGWFVNGPANLILPEGLLWQLFGTDRSAFP